MTQKKKNIVIVGGGTCGLMTAKMLAKKLAADPKTAKEYRLILINNTDVHVYHSDLYEISTAYNQEINAACLSALEDSVCITIPEVAKHFGFEFLKDTVESIDPEKKLITLKKNKELSYEYMLMAVGSVTNFYDIPGLKENAFPLKTLSNALELNCHVDQFFHERWEKKNTDQVHIVIGGGGATGVEYACELIGYLKKLAEKYDFSRKDIELSIIDGGSEFLGLGKKPSSIVKKRLRKLGIKAMQETYIKGYEDGMIMAEDKKTKKQTQVPADILIWTGGIKGNPLLQTFEHLNQRGELEVKETLESVHYPNIFAGGDNATILDSKTGDSVPKTGQFAEQEGKVIAHNIWADIKKQYKKQFHPLLKGYLIPLGGRQYLFVRGKLAFTGFIPFIMKKVHDIAYFNIYMPLTTAIKRIFTKERIFLKND